VAAAVENACKRTSDRSVRVYGRAIVAIAMMKNACKRNSERADDDEPVLEPPELDAAAADDDDDDDDDDADDVPFPDVVEVMARVPLSAFVIATPGRLFTLDTRSVSSEVCALAAIVAGTVTVADTVILATGVVNVPLDMFILFMFSCAVKLPDISVEKTALAAAGVDCAIATFQFPVASRRRTSARRRAEVTVTSEAFTL